MVVFTFLIKLSLSFICGEFFQRPQETLLQRLKIIGTVKQ